MISLQQLLGKDDRFFRLLEASAEGAHASVQALERLLKTSGEDRNLDEFAEFRRKDKLLTREISEHVLKTFVTALEREDIESLSYALHRIPKTVQKFAELYMIFLPHVEGVDFTPQVTLLGQATEQVVVMVKRLRRGMHLEKIKEENQVLQRLEGEADKLVLHLLRGLYGGQHDPFKIIALKELYEMLEKIIDRCRDAGNVVTHIVLKHT